MTPIYWYLFGVTSGVTLAALTEAKAKGLAMPDQERFILEYRP